MKEAGSVSAEMTVTSPHSARAPIVTHISLASTVTSGDGDDATTAEAVEVSASIAGTAPLTPASVVTPVTTGYVSAYATASTPALLACGTTIRDGGIAVSRTPISSPTSPLERVLTLARRVGVSRTTVVVVTISSAATPKIAVRDPAQVIESRGGAVTAPVCTTSPA